MKIIKDNFGPRNVFGELREGKPMGHSMCVVCNCEPCECKSRTLRASNPNDYQPGGAHYKVEEGEEQHWDFMDRWDVSALEYAATKYMERIGKGKGTDLLDCQKARHYVEKILDLHLLNGRPPRRHIPDYDIGKYLKGRKLDANQTVFFYKILQWKHSRHLKEAIAAAETVEARLSDATRHVDNTGQKHPFGYNDEE